MRSERSAIRVPLPRIKDPARGDRVAAALSQSMLFSDLGPAELAGVVKAGRLVASEKDEPVIRPGCRDDSICFVVQGAYSCRKTSPSGLLFVLDHCSKPGDFFGELSLISDGPCDMEVVATKPSRAVAFSAADFRGLMARHPAISRRMIEEMASRIGRLSDLSFELATMKIDARLRRVIGKLASASNQLHDGGVIRPAPTHAELATMLGTTREVVSRSMLALCRQGSISTSRQEIMIRSVHRLSRAADQI